MKKFLLVLILLVLIASVDARMPKVGDHVRVITVNEHINGHITDISNGFICLNCSSSDAFMGEMGDQPSGDICIGVGQIDALTWL